MAGSGSTQVDPALIEMRGVSKRFGGVHAVERVDLALRAGEVVGVLGHNGAGKSTLMKTLSGALPADEGEILVAGRSVAIRSPRDARRLGIEALYQGLALADNLGAAANLFLGRELLTRWRTLDDHAMERAAGGVLARVNPALRDLRRPVRQLSGGERQSIAIARAIYFQARVLIMDEPTAALGPAETRRVAGQIRRLAEEGIGIFLVSHDLHGAFELSDRIAVMKNGSLVACCSTTEVGRDEVLAMMITGEPGPTSA